MYRHKVSIIIATWSPDSKAYLDACVESVKRLNYPQECLDIIIVGRDTYAPKYDGVRTVYPPESQFGAERAFNLGESWSDADSKHLLFLNDDTVLTENSLSKLVDLAGDADGLFMPISPCDNYWKYQLSFQVPISNGALQLTDRFYRLEDFKEHMDDFMRADSLYPAGALFTEMLCTFAVLIPRTTWRRIGQFDEGFDLGQSDFDYCLRAKQLGIPRVIALNALIWHFGGATSNTTHTSERKSKNARHYRSKWGVWPEGFDANALIEPSRAELRELGFIGE